MCMYGVILIFNLCFLCFSESIDFKVVDLTHAFSPSTIYWPGSPEYNFTILNRENISGHWYESNFVGTAEHGGTHLDAPAHFNKGRWRTHSIPVENLVGPGVIIDVKSKATLNPDYTVAIDDLKQWEIMYGRIPDRAVVFMNSGWHERYPNATLVFNSDDPTNPTTYHFPSWHEDTISWLISERSVVIVGVDTPSVDEGQTTRFPVHALLGAADICGVENVANLDMVPNSGSVIVVAVMKIFDGSGGPARIIATVPREGESSGLNIYSWLLLTVVFLISIMIILKRLSTHS